MASKGLAKSGYWKITATIPGVMNRQTMEHANEIIVKPKKCIIFEGSDHG
jgi:hypothetical protein